MQRTYCVFNQTGESVVGLNIRRADSPLARLRGLLGQFRMKSFEGLWVVPSRGLHPVGLAPIDMIYLDARYRVIHLVEHLRPCRIAPIRLKSSSVLALRAHTIYSSQTHLGDQFIICPPEEMEACLREQSRGLAGVMQSWKGAEVEDPL